MADDGMELRTFVSDTLTQIIQGVEEAGRVFAGHETARVNPFGEYQAHTGCINVDFDVAVTVRDKIGGSGKASLRVVSLSFGGSAVKEVATEAISRVRFAVPVSLPATRERPAKPLPGFGEEDNYNYSGS
ncbi:hypothetical protein ABIE65_004975 [Constrictibacter sp. MBR-5]|jgi:hypothetical protein|uniref:hypothetical protein n=1 Tax=Constrictibacter sp. MBR-5 TaxID=3156467 RepID=UPI00339B0974